MPAITITNNVDYPVYIGDFYSSIPPKGTIHLKDRSVSSLDSCANLKQRMLANEVTVQVAYKAEDVAAGFVPTMGYVQAGDIAPALADASLVPGILLRKEFKAGNGELDDVEIFRLGSFPFRARVCDAWLFVSSASAVSGLAQLRTAPAGKGMLVATFSTATTGRNAMCDVSSAVVEPGEAVGLFLRRTPDSRCVGEVFVVLRPEI